MNGSDTQTQLDLKIYIVARSNIMLKNTFVYLIISWIRYFPCHCCSTNSISTTVKNSSSSNVRQEQRCCHPPQGAETTEMGGGEIEVVEQINTKGKRINSEQKERVKAFAEKIGWRWTKYNEEVKPFCAEIGITPYFLKNWIDNNRRRFGPKKTI